MNKIRLCFFIMVMLLLPSLVFSQVIAKKEIPSYECLVDSLNKIDFLGNDSSRMFMFFNKLDTVILNQKGQVNIMHIGGSHVQADVFTNRVRHNLKDFNNQIYSGRGIIFPYSVAKTNNPSNYKVYYKGEWTAERNVKEEKVTKLGMTGISVTTSDPLAEITIDLNPVDSVSNWHFTRLRLLGYASSQYVVPILKLNDSLYLEAEFDTIMHTYNFILEDSCDVFTVAFKQNDTIPHSFTLTGFLPENDIPGIIYHSIGVNGADVPDYLSCDNFEHDLKLINPDLVVFAIGINDTFSDCYSDSTFMKNYNALISKIENVSPNCFYVFVTNNDSYRKKNKDGKTHYYVNENGDNAREVFRALAEKHNATIWDLFGMMGGLKSMSNWEKEGLAKKDKIHFTNKGYTLIGDLFFNALMDFYLEKNKLIYVD